MKQMVSNILCIMAAVLFLIVDVPALLNGNTDLSNPYRWVALLFVFSIALDEPRSKRP